MSTWEEDAEKFLLEQEEDDEMLFFGIVPAIVMAMQEEKRPVHTSSLPGAVKVKEILEGHENWSKVEFRMEPEIFRAIVAFLKEQNLLHDTRGVHAQEQFGMFMYMLSHNASNDELCKWFQHSGETIHRKITEFFDIIPALTNRFVKLPNPNQTHVKIATDSRFMPFFQHPTTEKAMSGVATKFVVTSMVMWIVPVAIVYGFYYQMIPGVSQLSSSTQTLISGFLAIISVNLVIGFYICMAMKETPQQEAQPDPTFLANAKASINQPSSSQPNDDSKGKGKVDIVSGSRETMEHKQEAETSSGFSYKHHYETGLHIHEISLRKSRSRVVLSYMGILFLLTNVCKSLLAKDLSLGSAWNITFAILVAKCLQYKPIKKG